MAVIHDDILVLARNPGENQEFVVLELLSLKTNKTLCYCQLPVSAIQFALRFQKHPPPSKGANHFPRFGGLYAPDPQVEILAIIFYTALTASPDFFTVVISIPLFLSACYSLIQKHTEQNSDIPYFRWEDWGPDVTRWLPLDFHGEYGSRNASGSKLLAIYWEGTDADEAVLRNALLDFTPWPIRLGAQSRGEADDDYIFEVFDEETEWSWEGMKVKSKLPFRAWISSRPCDYLNLFLDGNTIVGRQKGGCHFFSFLPESAVKNCDSGDLCRP
ncbi:hypothetical protein M408DRAFT_205956 [Serendipita vermifera MAFF 305830]|uniref:Uncharacterized protein n=1 Tax=Serendipita vermifera MAFF 305830 TaxID=933852 RepID=A0A0C2X8Y9_SERVB|nr:hypothetical protein M408DRAFT_205956 [Serendipita vermifera MAFF 305830]